MKITLWIPAADSPRWPCVMSWLHMDSPEGSEVAFVRSGANNIKYSWNKVVQDFLKSDSEWLFSSHNDVVFDPQTLNRLLSWNKPLVSATVFMRTNPVIPHIWASYDEEKHRQPYVARIQDTYDWFRKYPQYLSFNKPFVMEPKPEDSLFEIDFTSTSCCIIHRDVLQDMKKLVGEEWFRWDNDYNGGGEDRHFFEIARAVGYPAYVDRSCVVGHLPGDVPTGLMDFVMSYNSSNFVNTGEMSNE